MKRNDCSVGIERARAPARPPWSRSTADRASDHPCVLPGNIRCSCGTIGRAGGRGTCLPDLPRCAFLTTVIVSFALISPRAFAHVAGIASCPCCRAVTVRCRFRCSRSLACAGQNISLARRALRSSCRASFVPNCSNLDDGNARRRVEHQRLAIGRKRIVVEIECRAAGVIRQSHHSMPGLSIDPVLVFFFFFFFFFATEMRPRLMYRRIRPEHIAVAVVAVDTYRDR